MAPTAGTERNEATADVDMDVVHGGVRHDAAGAVVDDQPLHHLQPAAGRGVEIDGIAAGVPRRPPAACDHRAGTACGDDPHTPELRLDTLKQSAGRRREAAARYATASETGNAARGHPPGARLPGGATLAPAAHRLAANRAACGGAALSGPRRPARVARLEILPVSFRIRPIAIVNAQSHMVRPRLRACCNCAQRGNADGHRRKTSHDRYPLSHGTQAPGGPNGCHPSRRIGGPGDDTPRCRRDPSFSVTCVFPSLRPP